MDFSIARSLSGAAKRPRLSDGGAIAASASQFFGWIGPQIDFRALQAGVTEPE